MLKPLLILCVVVLSCLTMFFKCKGEHWHAEAEATKVQLAETTHHSDRWYRLYKQEWDKYERLRAFIAKDAHE